MAIFVSGTEKSSYTPIEEGTYCALCYGLIDIGYTYSEKFDQETSCAVGTDWCRNRHNRWGRGK